MVKLSFNCDSSTKRMLLTQPSKYPEKQGPCGPVYIAALQNDRLRIYYPFIGDRIVILRKYSIFCNIPLNSLNNNNNKQQLKKQEKRLPFNCNLPFSVLYKVIYTLYVCKYALIRINTCIQTHMKSRLTDSCREIKQL